MSRVHICGLGSVSPGGWGVPALRDALAKAEPLPVQGLERPGWDKPLRTRPVPPPPARPAYFAHPRLRRVSALTQYAAAATLEAFAELPQRLGRAPKLGLIACMQSGPVQYATRFFQETLKDPATASPLLFPETVFAAPASHVAALLGDTRRVNTLVGDPATFLQGLAMGIEWLEEERMEACLVFGAEEINWLHADALWHFDHAAILSAGAGAVCLTLDETASLGVELSAITDAHTYAASTGPMRAAQAMRAQLPPGSLGELLCDSVRGNGRFDAAERAAWQDWPGARLSPKSVLGEGLAAAGAWQVVAAANALATGRFTAANVSIVGNNQQAIGARLKLL